MNDIWEFKLFGKKKSGASKDGKMSKKPAKGHG